MNEIIAEKAHNNYENIIGVKNRIGKDLLQLGFLLRVNHDNGYYKTLDYDTWESFLAIPEISMSRFFAHKLMHINRVWIEEFNVSQEKLNIDSEKLFDVANMITGKNLTPEELEENLEIARNWSRSDVRKLKSGKEYEYERYKVVTCPKCKTEFKVTI